MSGADLDPDHDATPALLTPAAVAQRWSISPRTLERWRAQGTGPAWLGLGGQVRYRLADVVAHEAAVRHGPRVRQKATTRPEPAMACGPAPDPTAGP